MIYLDASAIIYWVEGKLPHFEKLTKVLKKNVRPAEQYHFVTSRISLIECMIYPLKVQDKDLLQAYYQFFSAPDLLIRELSADVADVATRLRVAYGLKTPDAIHAASALTAKDKSLFVTGDKSFKQVHGLQLALV